MMISGGRTEQLDIFCCVTSFTSDFLSFIVVELIWFFHGALQLFIVVVMHLFCIFDTMVLLVVNFTVLSLKCFPLFL